MIKAYNRQKAVEYAHLFAYNRNPDYYNFDSLGGDCTNFVSQCVYAGSLTMNVSINGWYYNSVNDRAPAWTAADFFYDFFVNNEGRGPFAIKINSFEAMPGDVVILQRLNGDLFHSVIISKIVNGNIFVCSHTRDGADIPLENFFYSTAHYLHIQGVKY